MIQNLIIDCWKPYFSNYYQGCELILYRIIITWSM